jgi:hypothetical protein
MTQRPWLSTTGKSRTAKVMILIVAMAFGFTVAIVSEKAFGVEAKGPCANVRPESSRMACRYDHGQTRARQMYPAHFVRLAKRAHRLGPSPFQGGVDQRPAGEAGHNVVGKGLRQLRQLHRLLRSTQSVSRRRHRGEQAVDEPRHRHLAHLRVGHTAGVGRVPRSR